MTLPVSGRKALNYQASYLLLRQLLKPFGYDINDCDAIYYTTSQFYITVWNEDD